VKTAIFTLNEELVRHLTYHLTPLSFDIAYFSDPAKAIDLIGKDYDLFIFDVSHFPRHWKPFCKLLRDTKNKEQTILILIKAIRMPFEEAAKAIYLGVNGIIEYDENDAKEIFRLTEIFKRYRSVRENRNFLRVIPDHDEVFHLIATNPRTGKIVAGYVKNISVQGIMLTVLDPRMIERLEKQDLLPRCSLQIGDRIVSIDCRVARPGKTLGLEFTAFNDDAHHRLFTYLMERPARQLSRRMAGRE